MSISRATCVACYHPIAVGFHVPNEVWERVVPLSLHPEILCLRCFTRLADEMLIAWDKEIKFYPLSFATLHNTDRPVDNSGENP